MGTTPERGRPPPRCRALLRATIPCGMVVILALSGGPLPAFLVKDPLASPSFGPFVGTPAQKLAVPRGEAPSQVEMNGKYPDRTRLKGGGRQSITTNRKPVSGYAIQTDFTKLESARTIFKRMEDNIDMDLTILRQRTKKMFLVPARYKVYSKEYYIKLGKRRKERRLKRQYEELWQNWLRTKGKAQGLIEPVIYNGPIPELAQEMKEIKARENSGKHKELMQKLKDKTIRMPNWKHLQPEDILPGKWDEGPMRLHNLFKRPCSKYPYDIARGGKVMHGNVRC